ncbi:hypothetical protein F441_13842 [Phytophthora nicotianae CJ01A1]|uniref:Uncharacterized protein n=3 Tax=Phytophthora nicotianae TaxID=4792 RepID=W2PXM2_PHYN3|nr:hypothetical protein PPTG_14121 [Phytophthora nicotianae INRA-310]XP_008909350.1 hypothetical protein PPTG_23506 [Phytophthora nicotianae INRA-310]ETN05371.1 hypothetical protein PPTG_14121 [Phytophthora nicotianae INRA-310]ETN05375.1 hypothetical protein PPTG_23506 [Phytophthora nicotianae INRA-310]ETP10580.1 hypothetical protein F441_13842 [Phytophthora nicotianae CJ01A1]
MRGEEKVLVVLRQHIAECSNFYLHEQVDYRVHAYFEMKKQKDMKDTAAGRPVITTENSTVRDMRQDFLSERANHYRQDGVGAISHGIFGQYVAHDRFLEKAETSVSTANKTTCQM